MKKIVLLLLFTFNSFSYAQTARVLIVGDSWAQLQFDNDNHNQIFIDNGYANFTIDVASDLVSENGREAADWAMPGELQNILDIINTHPDIDTVQLTIGGNDFLNAWNINMTMLEEQALQQQILADLTTIAEAILAQDTTIEVVLSFYDYPNFEDTIGGIFGSTCRDLNNDMGQPTTTALNTAATVFEQIYLQLAANNPRIYHVSHFGLMQSFFGFPDDNILPGDILPPGDISKPSPIEAMRDFGVTRDCFHLTPDGYEILVQNIFDGYFHARFDTIFRTSFD